MTGRFSSESVADFNRIRWPVWCGISKETKRSCKSHRLNGFSQVWKDIISTAGTGLAKINLLLLRPKRKVLLTVSMILLAAVSLGAFTVMELQTSYIEARCLAHFVRNLSFSVKPGPNPSLRFPQQGPYDKRLGYTQWATRHKDQYTFRAI